MLDRLQQHFQALASMRIAHVDLLQGRLCTDGTGVSAIYAGNGSNAEYLIGTLFDGSPSRLRLATCAPLALPSTLARFGPQAEIVMSERAPLWSALGPRLGEIRMPAWIRQELHLKQSGEPRLLGRHLEREVERQIRRHGYRLAVSTAEADKQVFFEEFYVPYLRSRHGAGAITATREKFLQVASGSTLAQLFSGDSWTAGMLLHRRAQGLKFGWFGSRQNPPSPGASEVLDVLTIKDAASRGIRHIGFGNSRPSLIDGVLRYKQKFGAHIVIPRYPQTVFEIQLRDSRPALREWLTSRRFVCGYRGTVATVEFPANGPSTRPQFVPVPEPE